MKIRWTPEAWEDRRQIWFYIAAENPVAACQLDLRFSDAVESLSRFPEIGRMGAVPGTRELIPHENYRILYEITANTVWILSIVRAARQWPPISTNDE